MEKASTKASTKHAKERATDRRTVSTIMMQMEIIKAITTEKVEKAMVAAQRITQKIVSLR